MKYAEVVFEGNPKPYRYIVANNVELVEGAKYEIVADGRTTYSSPITVKIFRPNVTMLPDATNALRTITAAKCIKGNTRVYPNIKKVVFNKSKRTTTIVWSNNKPATTIHCAEEDEWDEEKGLALCMLKAYFKNRGYYNDWMRNSINSAERIGYEDDF